MFVLRPPPCGYPFAVSQEDLPDEAAERLHRVTKLLQTQRSLPARLEAVVAIVKRTVPNCDAAGIILTIEGQPTTSAVTDRLTVEVDLVQYRSGEGPCLAALASGEVIRIDLIERDSRFTRMAPGSMALDVNSVLSIPLVVHGQSVGAMNLYSKIPDGFDDRSLELARPTADYAAEVIASSPLYAYSLDLVEGLMETVESRTLIEQAKGVIMETERGTNEEALDRLRMLALTSGEAMPTVARWVIEERPTGPFTMGDREHRRRQDK
jgi:GAF domain-containing protein